MSTIVEAKKEAYFKEGKIVIRIGTDVEISFPVAKNPRLSKGTEKELSNIEISPFGLHWPDLDEDLSFEGLRKGQFGQE